MEEKIKELKYIIRNVDEPSTTTTYIGYALQCFRIRWFWSLC